MGMIGRIVGALIGLLVAAIGFGIWKPATAAKWQHVVDFSKWTLGPFGAHHTIMAFLIMAVGLVMTLAALQRETARPRRKPTILFSEPEPSPHPAPAHDDHAHDAQVDHGHAAPAHH
jgi:hypothetical protein